MTNSNDYRHYPDLSNRILPNLDTLRPHFEDDQPKFQELRNWLTQQLGDPMSRSTPATKLRDADSSDVKPYVEKYESVPREDWLTALESGQYAQVHGSLWAGTIPSLRADHSSLEYCRKLATCCLGVAPKLALLPFRVTVDELLPDSLVVKWLTPSTSEAAALIEGLREWESHLAMFMNDTIKLNFRQIAAVFRLVWNMPRPDQTDTQAEGSQ